MIELLTTIFKKIIELLTNIVGAILAFGFVIFLLWFFKDPLIVLIIILLIGVPMIISEIIDMIKKN